MKYIFFTDLRSSKVVPKGIQSQNCRSYKKSFLRERSVSLCSKVVPKGMQSQNCQTYKKSFLKECIISFLLKSRSKGNAEPNTAEIEGEEVQKTFLRGCRTYITEIEGEEVQKTFLRGCRTYITEIEDEEAQKSFLRGCRACVFQCGRVGVCLRHSHHFASYHHIISHNITSYIILHQRHKNRIRSQSSANASSK
jgi:hypothetical protein